MKKKNFRIFMLLSLALFFTCGTEKAKEDVITTGSLFKELIDLARLAQFPEPAFRTVQFSSYDRRSKIPGGPDWFANSDGFGNEPKPNFEKVLEEPDAEGIGEYLIADVRGPGAIVRLWSAAITGKIRLFIDGRPSPLYDGPAVDFFHRVYDLFPQAEKLNREQLRKTVYQRDACYAPIPFAKGIRIIWTGDLKTLHFYQIQVRLYEPGTKVISFSPDDLTTYGDTIDQVAAA